MPNRAATTRYARALFEVSLQQADPRQVERDLNGFADLLAAHEALGKVLRNPAVPTARKRALVSAIVERAPTMVPAVARVLVLLAEHDRLGMLPELVDAYRARLMDHLKMVRADVTTAAPLPRDRAEALRRSLSTATGKEVSVVTRLEPALLGGVIVRVGSTVYDGSLARHLERLKDKLVERT